jgi:5-methylcytosine-specific restriction endonuclease McrBC GTP-binding regulatory subunit McrB
MAGDPGGATPHVLLIDEINRGNLSKLLGELLFALEYRGQAAALPFRKERPLVVPKNLYIIATMNSSDKSIGHIDVAVRRRFALYHMAPDAQVVVNKWKGLGDEKTGNRLAKVMEKINENLHSTDSAQEDCGVGQSYFLPYPGSETIQDLLLKLNHALLPLLAEYNTMLGDGAIEVPMPFTDLEAFFKHPW